MPGKIFISYRREDEQAFAVRLYERLAEDFGKEGLFFDIDSIPPGFDFVKYIETQIALSDIVLVVIGQTWLSATDQHGRRRLDNPEDFVRVEIESALKQNKHVVPILVEGAPMPLSTELPRKLQPLARRNAFFATHGGSRSEEVRLIKALQAALERLDQEKAVEDARAVEEGDQSTRERPTPVEAREARESAPLDRPDLIASQGKELTELGREGLDDAAQQRLSRRGAPAAKTAMDSTVTAEQKGDLEGSKDSEKTDPAAGRPPALGGQQSTKRDPSRTEQSDSEYERIPDRPITFSSYILRLLVLMLIISAVVVSFKLVISGVGTRNAIIPGSSYSTKMGISFSELYDARPTYGITGVGVVVSSVENGSAAEIAGVKPGLLVVSIGTKSVRTIQDLTSSVDDIIARGEKRTMFAFRDPDKSGVTVYIFVPLN